jgi:FAD/FMN-containing dehydrogenase
VNPFPVGLNSEGVCYQNCSASDSNFFDLKRCPLPHPVSDYGKLYTSWAPRSVARPRTLADVVSLVKTARQEGRSIRVRGSGHTFSGATLPRDHEIFLRTDALGSYRYAEPGTVTVGAGAIAWDVRDFVANHGWLMPVYNGGWAGPTIGGFVSAGGMGLRVPPADRERWLAATARGETVEPLVSISETFGGFWEHVGAVTMVDGTGAVHEFTPDDPEFPWLFGSFGQLGIFVRVTLKLIEEAPHRSPYPLGVEGEIPRVQAEDPAINDHPPSPDGERLLFWFSYLVPVGDESIAWSEIAAWVGRHADFLRPQGGWVGPVINGEHVGYRYVVRFQRFHPPLLYSRAEDFVLMGLMATFDRVGTWATDERILQLEREFVDAARRRGFHLYPQAENIVRGLDYAQYYGADTFARFGALKRRFDPDGIINPGVVFPSALDAPPRSSIGQVSARTFERLFGGS